MTCIVVSTFHELYLKNENILNDFLIESESGLHMY